MVVEKNVRITERFFDNHYKPEVRLRRIEGFKSTDNATWETKTPFMDGH